MKKHPILKAAESYQGKGFIPSLCQENKKAPVPGRKWKELTIENCISIVEEDLKKYPSSNLAIVIPEEIICIDIDRKSGVDGLENLKKIAPSKWFENEICPMQKTPSGGYHLVYRLPEALRNHGNQTGKLPHGIDVRSNGQGYILTAPSTINGIPYKWERPLIEIEFLPIMPAFIADALLCEKEILPIVGFSKRTQKSDFSRFQNVLDDAIDKVRTAQDGVRNATLNEVVYTLSGIAADENINRDNDIINNLLPAATESGLPQNEALKTIESALRAGNKSPLPPKDPPVLSRLKMQTTQESKVLDDTDNSELNTAYYTVLSEIRNGNFEAIADLDTDLIYHGDIREIVKLTQQLDLESGSDSFFILADKLNGGLGGFNVIYTTIENAARKEINCPPDEKPLMPIERAFEAIQRDAYRRQLFTHIERLSDAVQKCDFVAVNKKRNELDTFCEQHENRQQRSYGFTLSELRTMATQPVWLVDGIIAEGSCGFIGALEKMGKTWFALYLAICVSLGRDFIGRKTQRRRVLYIGAEGGKAFLVRRIDYICNGLGIHPDDLDIVLHPEAIQIDTAEGVLWLKQAIRRHGIGLVIIDPLTRCHSKKENESDQIEPINTELRNIANKHNCSFVVLHHASKAGGRGTENFDPLRGSGAFKGFADFVLGLKPISNPNGIQFELTSILRDAPALDRMIYSISISEISSSFAISWEPPEAEPTRADKSLKILELLSSEPNGLPTRIISERTKINPSSIKTKLEALEKSGRIVKSPKGNAIIWTLQKKDMWQNEYV